MILWARDSGNAQWNGSSCLAVVETSAEAALMAADGWHGSAGFRSGAVLLAVGRLPQFFSVWHVQAQGCSHGLLHSYAGCPGWRG